MKTQYMYLGEMRLEGYDLVIIANTEAEATNAMIAEWKAKARKRGTDADFPIETATADQLQDHLENWSVRQIPVGMVVWP